MSAHWKCLSWKKSILFRIMVKLKVIRKHDNAESYFNVSIILVICHLINYSSDGTVWGFSWSRVKPASSCTQINLFLLETSILYIWSTSWQKAYQHSGHVRKHMHSVDNFSKCLHYWSEHESAYTWLRSGWLAQCTAKVQSNPWLSLSCTLSIFSCFCFHLLTFFKINFFNKFF